MINLRIDFGQNSPQVKNIKDQVFNRFLAAFNLNLRVTVEHFAIPTTGI